MKRDKGIRVRRGVPRHSCFAIALLGILLVESAHAVILFRTADPSANTTAPTNDPAGNGWNYEGHFGSFLGTPIAPHFFLTAKHIFQAASVFTFGEMDYTIVAHFYDPFSDFAIWKVVETFPTFAPLYSNSNETGLRLIVVGRGTQRGSGVFLGQELRGWYWGSDDGVQRWGENTVADIVNFSSGPDDAIYATFDQKDGLPDLPDESHISRGDSGGGVFIQDGAVWKLAGLNSYVDGHFYSDTSGNGEFDAALFDARGFYYSDGGNPPTYTQITGTDAVPSGFYATRVSSKLAWIYSVIDPTGDADSNGHSNLLDYALLLNSVSQPGYGMTGVMVENGFLELIYRKILNASSLQYQVEVSTDLVSWDPATSQDETVRTDENVQTIKAKVAIGSNTLMVLRLRITESQAPGSTAKWETRASTSARAAYKTGSAR